MTAPVLVLGIGNDLLGDDAAGVVAARRLARSAPPGVEVLDGGTLGLELAPLLADRHTVVVLDAVSPSLGPPGTVVVLREQEIRLGHHLRATAHDVGLTDALAVLELTGHRPRHLALVGVVPASLDVHYGLTPVVGRRIDEMVRTATGLLPVRR